MLTTAAQEAGCIEMAMLFTILLGAYGSSTVAIFGAFFFIASANDFQSAWSSGPPSSLGSQGLAYGSCASSRYARRQVPWPSGYLST